MLHSLDEHEARGSSDDKERGLFPSAELDARHESGS